MKPVLHDPRPESLRKSQSSSGSDEPLGQLLTVRLLLLMMLKIRHQLLTAYLSKLELELLLFGVFGQILIFSWWEAKTSLSTGLMSISVSRSKTSPSLFMSPVSEYHDRHSLQTGTCCSLGLNPGPRISFEV